MSCETRLLLLQSRVLTKCSARIPNPLVLSCQNKLFLQLFFDIIYETAPQILHSVITANAPCCRGCLVLSDDKCIPYIALNYLLGWFCGLVNVYEVPPCLWTTEEPKCSCFFSVPQHWHNPIEEQGTRGHADGCRAEQTNQAVKGWKSTRTAWTSKSMTEGCQDQPLKLGAAQWLQR